MQKKKNILHLGAELTHNLLARLPAEFVIQCKLVCKTWKEFIEDPDFLDMHTRHLVLDQSKLFSTCTAMEITTFYVQTSLAGQGQCAEYNDTDNRGSFKVNKQRIDTYSPQLLWMASSGLPDILHLAATLRAWCPLNEAFKDIIHGRRGITSYSSHLIVGSSNGLICIHSYVFQILNPLIKEHAILPVFFCPIDGWRFIAYGFGCCPSTNEYKVVCILYKSRFSESGLVQVYTVGSGTWRNRGKVTHSWELNSSRGMLVNGALYWMTTKLEIVSFNLEDEEVRIIQSSMPPPYRPPSVVRNLTVLGGCLCMIFCDKKSNVMDIWEMDKNECWTEKMSLQCKSSEVRAFALSKNGKLLLENCEGIISYDPRAKSSAYIYKWPDSESRRELIPYLASFISLKSLGEEVMPVMTSDQIVCDATLLTGLGLPESNSSSNSS